MRGLRLAIVLLALPFWTLVASGEEFKVQKLVDMGYSEIRYAQAIVDGFLFVGRASDGIDAQHKVYIYDVNSLAEVKAVVLPHSPAFIYPLSKNKAMVVGKQYTSEWHAYYTIIEHRSNNNFAVSTTKLPPEYFIDQFAGNEQTYYFSHAGKRAVYQGKGRSYSVLTAGLSGPAALHLTGDQLWVLERRTFQPDEQLVRLDLSKKTFHPALEKLGEGITHFTVIEDKELLVFNEWNKERVGFLNSKTGKLVSYVDVQGLPRGFAKLGQCVAVAAEYGRRIDFIHLAKQPFEVVGSWDLSAVPEFNCGPVQLSIDENTGRGFLRDSSWCDEGRGKLAYMMALDQVSGKTLAACR